MSYTFKNNKVYVVFMVLLFIFINKNIFSSPPASNSYKTDSIMVYKLCDSAKNSLEDYDLSLSYLQKANIIAQKISCQNCIAESEFNMGVLFSHYSSFDSSIYHFNNAINIFIPQGKYDGVVNAIEYISYAQMSTQNYHQAINMAKRGLEYSNSPDMNYKRANLYLNLGSCYDELGYFEKSADALINALIIYEANNDSAGISSALINLGLVFNSNGNHNDALEYTYRALEICKNIDDKYKISVCLNNIGNAYGSTGKHEKALEYFKQTLEIDTELDDIEGIAICFNNIGDTYRNLHDTILAISYYIKSLEIGAPGNNRLVSVTLFNLGEIYLSQGNLKLALNYANKSLKTAKLSATATLILSSYELLANIYSAMGSYKNGYNYLVKYKNLYDSIYAITKDKHIQEIKAKYNDEKQKSEIISLKKKSTSEIKYNTYLTRIIIAISLLIVVMIVFNIIVRRSKKLAHKHKLYYEKLLERSEDFIFVVDKNGLTKYISPSYESKIGREIQNRIGKSAFEFIHPDDIELIKNEFAMLIADKRPRNLEFRFKDSFNNWIDVYAYGQNMFGDGMIDGILVNFWDITQRKKNEKIISQSELKFRQIFNAFPDIYFQSDLKGVITEISPSVLKLTGYTREEMIGISTKEYYNVVSDWENIVSLFKTNSYIHDYDIQLIKKDRSIIDCSLSGELIYSQDDNKPIWFIGVLRDISSRIKSQEELRQSELKLKEANYAKEKLFSIISHDLIGPIGTNKSIVDLIVGQVNELTYEEIVSLITSLKPSLDSTYSLIENLLSWARIQQNKLKPNLEDVSLNILINEMVTLMNNQAKRKSITITTSFNNSINVVADKNQLDIIFRNVVSNAIKFSNRGEEILIEVNSINNFAEIKISDSGVGMSQKQIDNILSGNGNNEVKRGTDNEKGTGFGLVIVNEFIKNNNGILNINSKNGKGTIFTITLPLQTI